jgi:predicted MFS family arabinose efflux permease
VLAAGVLCVAASTALFLAATGIWLLAVARVLSGAAAGLVTGTATAGGLSSSPRRRGPPCDSWCSPELPVNTSARS